MIYLRSLRRYVGVLGISGLLIAAGGAQSSGARLLHKDVSLSDPVWCNGTSVLLDSNRAGLLLVHLDGKYVVIHKSRNVGATSCDEKSGRAIYVDTRTVRPYQVTPGQSLGIKDFSIFELATRRIEKVGAASGGGQLSPDGTRLFFFKPFLPSSSHISSMNVFVPDGPWNYANGLQAVWAADSKSIFIARSRRQEGKGYELWVAEGENGGRLLDTAFASIVRMRTLSNGGLLVVGHRQGEQNRRTLYQCNYGAVGAQACEAIATDVRVAGTSVDKGVIAYATYAASGETRCIWITSARSKQPRCAVSVRDNVGSISVSPDGTNLLYTLPRYIGREGTADTYTYDIFVVSLAKE